MTSKVMKAFPETDIRTKSYCIGKDKQEQSCYILCLLLLFVMGYQVFIFHRHPQMIVEESWIEQSVRRPGHRV